MARILPPSLSTTARTAGAFVALLFLAAGVVACGGEEPPAEGAAAEGTPAEGTEAAGAAEGEAKPAAEGEAKPAAEGEAKPAAEGEVKPAAEGEAKPPAEGEAAAKPTTDGGDPAPKPRTDAPSESDCQRACKHALAITEKELPADAKPELKNAMKMALQEECPKQCVARGSKGSLECVLKAKTAAELAACPQ